MGKNQTDKDQTECLSSLTGAQTWKPRDRFYVWIQDLQKTFLGSRSKIHGSKIQDAQTPRTSWILDLEPTKMDLPDFRKTSPDLSGKGADTAKSIENIGLGGYHIIYLFIHLFIYLFICLFIYACMYACMHGWIYGWMDVCIGVSVYSCIGVSYLCISVSVYPCIGASVYRCICVSVYLCLSVSLYLCIYVCTCMPCMHACMHACMYVWMNVWMYECIWIMKIHIYIYI